MIDPIQQASVFMVPNFSHPNIIIINIIPLGTQEKARPVPNHKLNYSMQKKIPNDLKSVQSIYTQHM